MNKTLIKDNLKILDALRGFAAIYVLVGHARWLLWEGYEFGYMTHPGTYSAFNKILMYFFSCFKFGNEAVLFFFVLSGFVIHYSVSRRIDKEGSFKPGDYLLKRVKRIYPPLLIAILITFIADRAGLAMRLPVYFSQTPYPSINENIHPQLTLPVLFGNLFFVQKIYTPVWGTDGPLWSLMYEWWFYMLYIPLIIAFRKNKYLLTGIVVIVWFLNLSFGAALPLLLHNVLNFFIIWFAGLLLADTLLYKTISPKIVALFLLLITGGALAGNYAIIGKEIILTVFIVIFLYLALTTSLFDFIKRFEKLGSFSYTLYAVHFPLVCFMSGLVMQSYNGFLPSHFLYVMLAIPICIIIGWALHLVGEKPFTKK